MYVPDPLTYVAVLADVPDVNGIVGVVADTVTRSVNVAVNVSTWPSP